MFISQENAKSLFWKICEYAAYVFFVLFPFVNFRAFLFAGTSSRSAFLIIFTTILGIGFAIWLLRKGGKLEIPKSPILLVSGIYFICLLVSGIFGFNFENTFWSTANRTTGIWYMVNLGLFLVFLSAIFNDRKKQDRLILCIIASAALYSFLYLLSPEGVGLIFDGYAAESFTFGNSSFAAMYIFGAFILSIYYLVRAEVKKWWMYALPIFIVISPDIVNRDVWFGNFSNIFGDAKATSYVIILSVAFLFAIWLISKFGDHSLRKKIAYSLFGLGILSLAVFAVSLFSDDGFVRKFYLERSTAARPLLWDMSENFIAQRPVFGWGGDNYERLFEKNYDNRLLQDEYGREAWFDRAHNVFIDQLVDNGVIGFLVYIGIYIVAILCLIHTILNSKERRDRILSAILITYFTLHLLELQTAFDTSISYPLIILMLALAAALYHRTLAGRGGADLSYPVNRIAAYAISAVLVIFLAYTFIIGWIPFVRAQFMNGTIRTIGNSEKRIPLYPVLFSSPVDKHAFLWRTITDFQRGIGENPEVLNNPKRVESLKKEAAVFEREYAKYVNENPEHFRAYLNMSDILIYQRLLGVNKLSAAQQVLDESIKLVPTSPQPHWMKAVAYVYMGQFENARKAAKSGLDLNPRILMSQNVAEYVEKSFREFPNIDLFFFRQI